MYDTDKKIYNVSRTYSVVRIAEVLASSEEEAEQLARKNVDNLHWKEYDGGYVEDVDFNVGEYD